MTAKAQTINQTDADAEEQIKAQLWAYERELLVEAQSGRLADDFVCFDETGAALGKSDNRQFVTANELTPLWAKFGAANSCCLAYLIRQADGSSSVCMALWIERDGVWKKVFHHHNANYK